MQVKNKIKWLSEPEIVRLGNEGRLRSLELLDCVSAIKGTILKPYPKNQDCWPGIINYRPLEMVTEILERHLTVITEPKGNSSLTAQEQLVKAAGFEKQGNVEAFS